MQINTKEIQNKNINVEGYDPNGLISLVLGILSIIFAFTYITSVPISIISIIKGKKSKNKIGKAGIILAIIALGLTCIYMIIQRLIYFEVIVIYI